LCLCLHVLIQQILEFGQQSFISLHGESRMRSKPSCYTMDKLSVTDMYKVQVANKLHGQRFRLQECVTKVQECMNSLEKEHAWEDHTTHLASLLDQMRTLVQAS